MHEPNKVNRLAAGHGVPEGEVRGFSQALYARLRANRFSRHTMIIAGGTIAGRALAALASPLLARLYQPSDFGLLSVFMSLILGLGTVASLNYEAAIPLPKDDELGWNVMGVSFAALFFNTLICAALVFFFGAPLSQRLGTPLLEPYLWLLPLSLLGGGGFLILNSWAVRLQAFKAIAKRRVIQSIAQVTTQVGTPLFAPGPFGLLLGDTLGRASGSIALALDAKRYAAEHGLRISLRKLAEAANRYRRFPVFGTASVLVHVSFFALPPLLLTRLFGLQEAGWYGLINQLGGAGIGLIGGSIGQVYISNAAQLAHSSPRQLRSLFMKTSRATFMIGVIPFGVLLFFGPPLFGFVFGSKWIEAGRYAQLLALPYLAVLSISPVFPALTVLERQDWQLIVDAIGVLMMVMGMFYAHRLGLSGRWAVAAYGVSVLLTYLALFFLALMAIKGHAKAATGSD